MGKSSLIAWLCWHYNNKDEIAKEVIGDRCLITIRFRDISRRHSFHDVLNLQQPFAQFYAYLLKKDEFQLTQQPQWENDCKKINRFLYLHQNCGKPFVAFNRSDTFYCDCPAPQDGRKSCKEYGAYYVRLEKVRHDEVTHIYKQVYNCLQNRYRRMKTPESPEGNSRLKAETEEFLGACRAWKQKIKAGDAVEMDYIIWLHKRKGEISNGEHPGEAE